jgi:predicted acetyltransferase
VSTETRPLTREDFDQSLALGSEAFGALPPGTDPPRAEDFPRPGSHYLGTFDDGRLVARVTGRDFHSWFGGAEVPTVGLAGVVVTPERRGEGLLAPLMREILDQAVSEHRQGISTLYPSATGIYRSFGYEVISSLQDVELPVHDLTGVRPATEVRTRRATVDDVDAIQGVYDAWAAAQNGPLTRRGTSFPADPAQFISDFTAVTVAVDPEDRVLGYTSWDRGQGWGPTATVTISDLLATSAEAYRALWRVIGSFSTIVGHVRLLTSGADAARLALPGSGWAAATSRPYMLRVHDVPLAFGARPWPIDTALTFAVQGDPLGTTDGTWRLTVTDGRATCEPTGAAATGEAPTYTATGLALAWAGAQNSANLRLSGHLGGPAGTDAELDRLLAPRPLHIRDFF